MQFLVVLQPTDGGYEAHAPDVEGCVARGRTREQVERQMRAVLEFHLAGLHVAGEPPPPARAEATYMEVVGGA